MNNKRFCQIMTNISMLIALSVLSFFVENIVIRVLFWLVALTYMLLFSPNGCFMWLFKIILCCSGFGILTFVVVFGNKEPTILLAIINILLLLFAYFGNLILAYLFERGD